MIAVISFLPVALSMSTFPFARFDRPQRFPIFFKSLPNGGNGKSCAFKNGGGKGRLGNPGGGPGIGKPGGGKGPGGSIGIGNIGIAGFPGELELSSLVSDGLAQAGIGPFFQPPGGGGIPGSPGCPVGRVCIIGMGGAMPAGNGGGIKAAPGGGTSQEGAEWGAGTLPELEEAGVAEISKNFPAVSGFVSRFIVIGLNFDSARLRSLLQSSFRGFAFDFSEREGGFDCIGESGSSDFVSKKRVPTIFSVSLFWRDPD